MNQEFSNLSFKEVIKIVFGVDLPIRGGIGNSLEKAVIIERAQPLNDYVSVQYEVLKYMALGRELLSWKVLRQELIRENGKTYDKLYIQVSFLRSGQRIEQVEHYYFDITECFGPEPSSEKNPDEQLEDMKKFLDKMLEQIEKDK